MLRSLSSIRLKGELADLELSEARLRPVLIADWDDKGIVLEPGYRLGSGQVLTGDDLAGQNGPRFAPNAPTAAATNRYSLRDSRRGVQ